MAVKADKLKEKMDAIEQDLKVEKESQKNEKKGQNQAFLHITDFKELLQLFNVNINVNNDSKNSNNPNVSHVAIHLPFSDTYKLLIQKPYFEAFFTWLKNANVSSLKLNNLPIDGNFFNILFSELIKTTSIKEITIENTALGYINLNEFAKILSESDFNKINLTDCKLGNVKDEKFLEFMEILLKSRIIRELNIMGNCLDKLKKETLDSFVKILADSTVSKLEFSKIQNSLQTVIKKILGNNQINNMKRETRSEIIFTCHPCKSQISKDAPFLTALYNHGLTNKMLPIIFEFMDCAVPKKNQL